MLAKSKFWRGKRRPDPRAVFGSGDYAFPHDLIAARRAAHQARHEPAVFSRCAGTTRDQYERRQELETRVRQLAAELHSPPYWEKLTGPELVAAHAAIKHADRAVSAEGA